MNAKRLFSHALRAALSMLGLLGCLGARAQGTHWRIEAESPQTRVLLRGDTLDITSPQGLSLWWDEPLEAPCVVEYRACVVMEGGPSDRLSDLNCFWMATDPVVGVRTEDAGRLVGSPLRGISLRRGRFVESYRLQCYYVGYGGNYNTTTRFRRYDADTLGIAQPEHRPPILQEYTDSAHLLRPNHWYSVRLEVMPVRVEGTAERQHGTPATQVARVRYIIDDEVLVDYVDSRPLLRGWFAFRTTWSHVRMTGWRVLKI